jgi:branched-chain amino acid transport system ATP-binding protein
MRAGVSSVSGPLLRVDEVSVRFGGLWALRGVSLQVELGEIVGLIGPNGSGKTTLLNAITGIYQPSRGRILFEGSDVSRLQRQEIAAAGIARTFQAPRLFPSLTLEQHPVAALRQEAQTPTLRRLRAHGGLPWHIHRETAGSLLRRLALGPFLRHDSATLPYGRQRLLEIARCLASGPRLLLLDEPAAGLNADETEELGTILLREAQSQEIALVVIEHDIAFIRAMCPRLIVLHQGELVCDLPAEEALLHPRTVSAYLGDD